MRVSRLWAELLGCENAVIEDVEWQEAGGPVLVAHAALTGG